VSANHFTHRHQTKVQAIEDVQTKTRLHLKLLMVNYSDYSGVGCPISSI